MEFVSDKRDRILAAAARLIVENGLRSPMSAIAQEAGVATGSLYTYFPSKDELIWAVYKDLAAAINGALIREIDPAIPHRERFMIYFRDYIDFIWADAGRAVLFEYLSNVPLLTQNEMQDAFAGSGRYINTLIAEAQAAGIVRTFSPLLIGALVGGGIRNSLKWCRLKGTVLTGEERDQIARMCWDAIAA